MSKNGAKAKTGILCACFVMMSYLAVSPALSDIAAHFSDAAVSAVQMLITLPTLIAPATALLAGKLSERFYKKPLLLWFMGAYLVGGLLPLAFSQSLVFLLFCAGVVGVGTGGMMTLTAALICDCFSGKEQDRMMGLQAAFISGGGMVFTVLGGALAGSGWQRAYLAYLLVVPAFVLVILWMPRGDLVRETTHESGKKAKIPAFVWLLGVVGFLFYACQNAFNTNASLLMTESGLGDTQEASVATALNTFGGLLSGILLSQLTAIFKKYAVPVSIAASCAGLFLTFFGTAAPVIWIGGFLVGFGFSMFTPAGTLLAARSAPDSRRSTAISLFSACSNIGSALSPPIVNALAAPFGAGVRVKFLVAAVILCVVVAGTTLYSARRRA